MKDTLVYFNSKVCKLSNRSPCISLFVCLFVRFIMKQGLDRTFVECDNHMWRVSNRPLPPDINVDGGSDWIAIHRNFSRYLVTGTDPFLVGLKTYYRYSLLPAEVHTP